MRNTKDMDWIDRKQQGKLSTRQEMVSLDSHIPYQVGHRD